MRIADVLRAKPGQAVVTIHPDATVRDLLALLAEHNIGAAIVSADGTSVDGIVSERDVVRRLHEDDGVLGAPVAQIMTSEVRTCTSSSSLDDVRSVMTERRFRHLPVVDDGQLIGVVSIGDIVKAHITQLELERDALDSYVRQA